jgi:hypothetical protein
MNRLNFILPDWTRIIWVSENAKSVWQNKIYAASNAFQKIEEEAVYAGMKPANLTTLSHSDFIKKQITLSNSEFRLIPLAKIKNTNSYSNTSTSTDDEYNYSVRCVLVNKNIEEEWLEAWNTSNDYEIGKLLGYPECCLDFFKKYWVEEKYIDTTYPMSLTGTTGPKECNILLRWIGIRTVSHLPCSFNCKHTFDIGRRNIELGRSLSLNDEMDTIEEMLDWPISWSALHGIAEIKTPILKISSRTDATGEIYIVNREGFSYPKEGASGTSFPYINKAKVKITQSPSFKRSLAVSSNLWEDNGFSSSEHMNNNHNILLDVIEKSKIVFNSVIDFGCGNAELLKKIDQKYNTEKIFGVEISEDRFNRIPSNFGKGSYFNKNIFDKTGEWLTENIDLNIIMYGRFLEEPNNSINLLNDLVTKQSYVLIYNYSDWNSSEEFTKFLSKNNISFKPISKTEGIGCTAYIGKFSTKLSSTTLNILS